jgi:hypothetical protein
LKEVKQNKEMRRQYSRNPLSSSLEDAHRALEMGLRVAPAGSDSLWYLRVNYWRYYLALKDYKNANAQIESLKNIKVPPDVNSWEEVEKWRWSQEIFARDNEIKSQAEKMWRSIVPAKPESKEKGYSPRK